MYGRFNNNITVLKISRSLGRRLMGTRCVLGSGTTCGNNGDVAQVRDTNSIPRGVVGTVFLVT